MSALAILVLLAAAPAPTTLDTVGAVLERTRDSGPHVVALVVVGRVEDLPDEETRTALMELVRAHPRVEELVVLPVVEEDPGRRGLANLAAEHGVAYVLVLRVFPNGAPAQLELLDELGAVLPSVGPAPLPEAPDPQVERNPIHVQEEAQGAARMAAYMRQAWVAHWLPGAIPGVLPNRPMVTTATGTPVALERVAATPGASVKDRRTLERAVASGRLSTLFLGWAVVPLLVGAGTLLAAPCAAGGLGSVVGCGVTQMCWGASDGGLSGAAVGGASSVLAAVVLVVVSTAFATVALAVPGIVFATEAASGTRQALHAAVETHNTVLANNLGLDLEAAEQDAQSSTAAPPTPGDAAAP